jgi:hypothetical protein
MQTSTPILAPAEPEPRDPLGHLGTWPFLGVVVLIAIALTAITEAIVGAQRYFYVMPIATSSAIALRRWFQRGFGMSRTDAFWRAFGVSWGLGMLTIIVLRLVERS